MLTIFAQRLDRFNTSKYFPTNMRQDLGHLWPLLLVLLGLHSRTCHRPPFRHGSPKTPDPYSFHYPPALYYRSESMYRVLATPPGSRHHDRSVVWYYLHSRCEHNLPLVQATERSRSWICPSGVESWCKYYTYCNSALNIHDWVRLFL